MNEPNLLEAELHRLQPRRASREFKRSTLERLREQSVSAATGWSTWAAGALAAACLAAIMLWSSGRVGNRPTTENGSPLGQQIRLQDLDPTVLAYRHVMNYAPQDLNALLDRQNASTLAPTSARPPRAFQRSDVERYR